MINNSAMLCPIVVKLNALAHCETFEVAELINFTSVQIQDGGLPKFSIFKSL